MKMREIKFRAKIIRDAKLYDVEAIDFLNLKILRNVSGSHEWISFANVKSLMQFTGLMDKNGKEIYAGDLVIVMFTWGNGDDLYGQDHPEIDEYQIVWGNSHGFELNGKPGSPLNGAPIHIGDTIEVVGNIYESRS